VPHYVAQPPCPKATLALLRRIEDLLDMTIPLNDLPEQAKHLLLDQARQQQRTVQRAGIGCWDHDRVSGRV